MLCVLPTEYYIYVCISQVSRASNAMCSTYRVLVDLILYFTGVQRERSGSVVECFTRDRRAEGSSLTCVTVLWSLSKTHLS